MCLSQVRHECNERYSTGPYGPNGSVVHRYVEAAISYLSTPLPGEDVGFGEEQLDTLGRALLGEVS